MVVVIVVVVIAGLLLLLLLQLLLFQVLQCDEIRRATPFLYWLRITKRERCKEKTKNKNKGENKEKHGQRRDIPRRLPLPATMPRLSSWPRTQLVFFSTFSCVEGMLLCNMTQLPGRCFYVRFGQPARTESRCVCSQHLIRNSRGFAAFCHAYPSLPKSNEGEESCETGGTDEVGLSSTTSFQVPTLVQTQTLPSTKSMGGVIYCT